MPYICGNTYAYLQIGKNAISFSSTQWGLKYNDLEISIHI